MAWQAVTAKQHLAWLGITIGIAIAHVFKAIGAQAKWIKLAPRRHGSQIPPQRV